MLPTPVFLSGEFHGWTEEPGGVARSRTQLSNFTFTFFNLYAEHIMRNAGLDEAQAGVKIARRNLNNLRYADDTTLWQKVKRN